MNENTRESWSAMNSHQLEELRALNHPAGPVRPWEVRVRAEVVVRRKRMAAELKSLEHPIPKAPRSSSAPAHSTLGIDSTPSPKPQGFAFPSLVLSLGHIRHHEHHVQKQLWCPIPRNKALLNKPAHPAEARLSRSQLRECRNTLQIHTSSSIPFK